MSEVALGRERLPLARLDLGRRRGDRGQVVVRETGEQRNRRES
jgi:hypothetical protein